MKTIITTYIILLLLLGITACEDFVQIDPPRTSLIKKTVFEDDVTANAAIQDIYYQLRSSLFASGGSTSISFLTTLLSDEQISYFNSGLASYDAQYHQFNDNTLHPQNTVVLSLWTDLYKCIYKANAAIEGLTASSGVSENIRQQLTGEAKFVRAFCYFYLVNLWGDVPLVLTSDWRANSAIGRTSGMEIYNQVVSDLVVAKNSLPTDYSFSNNERVRTNANVATALLARVYLFTERWSEAETEATLLIDNTSQYSLINDLNQIFLTNSAEAILQWWSNLSPRDRSTFRVPATPSYGAISPAFVNTFESNDLRYSTWINLNASGYYNARKYTAANSNPPLQYSTVFRLAEQYLIRAEARLQRGNVTGAKDDLNTIRSRATLTPITTDDETLIQLSIEHERKSELFTEWGHRWFDLKRWNKAGTVLSPIKPGWTPFSLLLPIPESEIKNNPALRDAQNPGY